MVAAPQATHGQVQADLACPGKPQLAKPDTGCADPETERPAAATALFEWIRLAANGNQLNRYSEDNQVSQRQAG